MKPVFTRLRRCGLCHSGSCVTSFGADGTAAAGIAWSQWQSVPLSGIQGSAHKVAELAIGDCCCVLGPQLQGSFARLERRVAGYEGVVAAVSPAVDGQALDLQDHGDHRGVSAG